MSASVLGRHYCYGDLPECNLHVIRTLSDVSGKQYELDTNPLSSQKVLPYMGYIGMCGPKGLLASHYRRPFLSQYELDTSPLSPRRVLPYMGYIGMCSPKGLLVSHYRGQFPSHLLLPSQVVDKYSLNQRIYFALQTFEIFVETANYFFTGIFVLEVIFKFIAFGFVRYFKDR